MTTHKSLVEILRKANSDTFETSTHEVHCLHRLHREEARSRVCALNGSGLLVSGIACSPCVFVFLVKLSLCGRVMLRLRSAQNNQISTACRFISNRRRREFWAQCEQLAERLAKGTEATRDRSNPLRSRPLAKSRSACTAYLGRRLSEMQMAIAGSLHSGIESWSIQHDFRYPACILPANSSGSSS